MNVQTPPLPDDFTPLSAEKFNDPDVTAKGERRARVPLVKLETLWFNTGTLCNIACRNCYIESSPTNDRLVYLKTGDVTPYLDEIADLGLGTREIAFTGGEPFMNPDMVPILEACLERGFEALVLTNAMRPLMRPRVQTGLTDLRSRFGDRLSLRISIDHYTAERHEAERGPRTFGEMLKGIAWLAAQGFPLSVAGRTCWGESDATARTGYRDLFARLGLVIDADDPGTLILFPEMDERVDVPEITTGCWKILGLSPADIMCASSRMIVKHQGDAAPTVMPCTLLPYDRSFGMGETLSNSLKADGGNFARGAIKLNHPHCAKFCVLGGGSCSAG